jgi:CO/xanthine dehydrogenase Mo-binding subunit
MTGFLHEKAFSRKSFVKGGGALVVGFSLAGSALAGKASAVNDPKAVMPGHTGLLIGPPDPNQIDSFIAIHGDNTASIYSGRVDLGQGTPTGLLMIAGEELDMGMDQLKFIVSDSNVTPDTGGTFGSSSITTAGPKLRAAGASAKQALLSLASTQLGVPVASLTVDHGTVSGGGRSITYGQLIGDKLFNAPLVSTTLTPFQAPAKTPTSYKLVTTSPPRIDIPDKVTGKYTYVQNVHFPGMYHARIVRPRGQGAYGTGAPILSVDTSSIKRFKDVQVVRKGDFLAVVAPLEYDAIQAAAELKVKWGTKAALSGDGDVYGMMRAQDAAGLTKNAATATGNVDAALASAAHVVSSTYTYDYQMHGPIGPCAAIANVTPTTALIITNTQWVYRLRTLLSQTLGMPESQIRVQYMEGSSAFGHCETDDAASAAAVISQLSGKPVRLQFMRWDDHGWDNYGPTQLTDVRAGVDAKGNIVGYDNTVWQMAGTNAQETTTELIGFGPLPASALAGGSAGSSGPAAYTIPNKRGTGKSVQVLNLGYLKTAPLRSPSSPTNFPAEVMIDELAHAAGMDPIAFRLQNASTQRTIDALNLLVQVSGWQPRVAASNLSSETVVRGRGVGLANPGGVVSEIEVNKKTGKIVVKHMYGVQDVGLTISPGLLENQMSGSMIQTASRALFEGIHYTKQEVTSVDWITYPILRFKDHPSVTTVPLPRLDQVPTGGGEPLVPGTPASIANAFFDATGVRIRQVPMTPGRIRAVLKAAGVK